MVLLAAPVPAAGGRDLGASAVRRVRPVTDAGEDLDCGLDFDDGPDCSWCGGEPWAQECGDPIQCCKPGCDGVIHGCDACLDTGLAKNQVMW